LGETCKKKGGAARRERKKEGPIPLRKKARSMAKDVDKKNVGDGSPAKERGWRTEGLSLQTNPTRIPVLQTSLLRRLKKKAFLLGGGHSYHPPCEKYSAIVEEATLLITLKEKDWQSPTPPTIGGNRPIPGGKKEGIPSFKEKGKPLGRGRPM